jgi:hypothetical protein
MKTFAEKTAEKYKDQLVNIYWSASGGETNYFDHSTNSNTYVQGVVLWGEGSTLAVECNFLFHQKKYTKEVLFNDRNILFVVLEGDDASTVGHILKETK